MKVIVLLLCAAGLLGLSVMTFIVLPRHKGDPEAINRIAGRFLIVLCPVALLGLVLAILSE